MRHFGIARAFAVAAIACVAQHASANVIVCAEAVNLEPGVVVESYPQSLSYDLTVTEAWCSWCATQDPAHWCQTSCPGGGSSLVLTESDPILEAFSGSPISWETTHPGWGDPVPMWLVGGQSVTTSVQLTLASYTDCATRARAIPPPYGPVLPDASGRIVVTDTYRVTWPTDGVPPYFVECSAALTCLPPFGQTRTLGYFKTHPAAVEACVADAGLDLGFLAVAQGDAATALGLLWASPSKYRDGKRRSASDQGRVLLGRQLLVAICNERIFGSSPVDSSLIAAARGATLSCANLSWLQAQLDAFNNTGDTGENYFGSASPGSYRDPTVRMADCP